MATRQRLGELNRAVLEVLGSQGPLPKAEVVARVREFVPPTPDEARPQRAGRPGLDRYTNRLGWSTTGMAAIGLMRKARSGWEITDAGRRMLAEVTDSGDFQGVVERRYKEHLNQERGAVATAERRELLERALSVVDAGTWTSYSDLVQLVGMTPVSVGTWLSSKEVDNGYRVLTVDGSVSPDFRWAGEDRGSPLDLLRDEGIQFDQNNRASPQQRLTTADLREALELGDSTQRRGWLVRGANVHGRNLLPDWFENGYCSIAAPGWTRSPAA